MADDVGRQLGAGHGVEEAKGELPFVAGLAGSDGCTVVDDIRGQVFLEHRRSSRREVRNISLCPVGMLTKNVTRHG